MLGGSSGHLQYGISSSVWGKEASSEAVEQAFQEALGLPRRPWSLLRSPGASLGGLGLPGRFSEVPGGPRAPRKRWSLETHFMDSK